MEEFIITKSKMWQGSSSEHLILFIVRPHPLYLMSHNVGRW